MYNVDVENPNVLSWDLFDVRHNLKKWSNVA